MKWTSYLFVFILTIATACEQDPPCYPLIEGCTDSLALNFLPEANIPSNDCEYAADKFVGTYAIVDSVFGGITADYFQREYELTILKNPDTPDQLLIQHWSFSNSNSCLIYQIGGPHTANRFLANKNPIISRCYKKLAERAGIEPTTQSFILTLPALKAS